MFVVRRHRWRSGRGQSLVELAIMAPVVLLIMLMAVDFGRVFLGWVTVTNMARIGANYASLNPKGFEDNDPAVVSQYGQLMRNDAAGIDCTLPGTLPEPTFGGYDLGDTVEVTIDCDFPLLTPFLSSLIGDGSGNVPLSATAIFNVRSGAVNSRPVNPPGITPPPASASPGPSSSPGPGPSVDPSATPLPPVTVSFYAEPASGQADAYGGGPPGSLNENQVVGIPGMQAEFTNTTTGSQVTCVWDFGDGSTQSSCANTVNKVYTTRGTYDVTLTVNGTVLARSSYVLIGCKVPNFQTTKLNSATGIWTNPAGAGFTGPVSTIRPPNGNYNINFQSLPGGQVNPPGGCSAGITVGP
jgi:Flp pilus assembly protein TadG